MFGVYSPKHYLSYAINVIIMKQQTSDIAMFKKKPEKNKKQDLREQYSVDYENVFGFTNSAESYQALPTYPNQLLIKLLWSMD